MSDRDTIERQIIELQSERARLAAQISACRTVLRQHDRLQRAVLVVETLQAGTVPPRPLRAVQPPAALDTPIIDAEVIPHATACPLCPGRPPFPTVQGLRLHEQRAHPEVVRERKQQQAREAAANTAYPRGRR